MDTKNTRKLVIFFKYLGYFLLVISVIGNLIILGMIIEKYRIKRKYNITNNTEQPVRGNYGKEGENDSGLLEV